MSPDISERSFEEAIEYGLLQGGLGAYAGGGSGFGEAEAAPWGDMPAGVAQGDVNLVYADEHFHETLANACGSSVLPTMLRQINARRGKIDGFRSLRRGPPLENMQLVRLKVLGRDFCLHPADCRIE